MFINIACGVNFFASVFPLPCFLFDSLAYTKNILLERSSDVGIEDILGDGSTPYTQLNILMFMLRILKLDLKQTR